MKLPLAIRVRVALHGLIARPVIVLLRALGLQQRMHTWNRARLRRRRAKAEASGSDRYSRPAQHDLDAKLDELFGSEPGFFVEAGANDGFAQSNTYWLERFRGWRGILVEPVPELAHEAELSRPGTPVLQAALVPADRDRTSVKMNFGDLMSSLAEARDISYPKLGAAFGLRDSYEVEVPARSLSSILDELGAPEVDLLSLDVEGYEANALEGLDLDRHAPRFILVEIVDRDEEKRAIDAVIGARYAEHSWLSPRDLLYARRDG